MDERFETELDAELAGGPNEDDLALASLYDAIQAGSDPRTALDDAIRRFPAYAAMLSDYAAMLHALASPTMVEDDALEPTIDSAIARAVVPLAGEVKSLVERARQVGIAERDLVRNIRISRTIWIKLERRLVDAATIPACLFDSLAWKLRITVDALHSYLSGPPRLAVAAEYKSRRAPKASRRESFDQAIATAVAAGEIGEPERVFWRAEANSR